MLAERNQKPPTLFMDENKPSTVKGELLMERKEFGVIRFLRIYKFMKLRENSWYDVNFGFF